MTVDLLADYPFNYGGVKYDVGLNIHNLLDRTYYTSEYLVSPLVGLGGSYGGRIYGDNFSILGHISAQFPGSPSAPPKVPPPAMTWTHDWSGSYAGLQAGLGWGGNDGTFSYFTPDGFSGSPSFITNSYGVLAGAHVGYNWQFDHWVLGLEGSVDVTDLNKREQLGWSNPDPNAYYSFSGYAFCGFGACGGAIDAHISSDIQGSLRARAGYAWNRLLLYGTGGLAVTNFNLQSSIGGQDAFGNFYYRRRERSLGDAPRLDWRRGRRICDHASLVGARGISLLRLRPYRGDAHLLLDDGALLRGRLPRHAAAGSSRGQL